MNFDGRGYDTLRRADEHEAEVEAMEEATLAEIPGQVAAGLTEFLDQVIGYAADESGLCGDALDISSFHVHAIEAVAAEATRRLAEMRQKPAVAA